MSQIGGIGISYGGITIIAFYIILMLITFSIYIAWFLNEDIKDEYAAYALLVILGIIYVGAMIATMYGYHIFGSCLVFVSLVFTIIIAAVTKLESKNDKGKYTFSSLGCSAMLCGMITASCFAGLIYSTWSTGFLLGPVGRYVDPSLRIY